MTQNTRHRGIAALSGHGGRRGWQSVGRATPRARTAAPPERCVIRPTHEGGLYRRRQRHSCIAPLLGSPQAAPAAAESGAPALPDLALVVLAMFALLVVPLQLAGSLLT